RPPSDLVRSLCCSCFAPVSATRPTQTSSFDWRAFGSRAAGGLKVTNQYQTAQLRELDSSHHLHPMTNHKSLRETGDVRIMVRGDGPYLWDSEGVRVLDGMSGLWTANVGHSRKELAEAAYAQMLELPYYNTFFRTTHPTAVLLARKLAEL